MSELKMVSPLLDNLVVEKEISRQAEQICYTLQNPTSGERHVLKHQSIPASDGHVRALILSGAYADDAAVHEYYTRVVEDMRRELEIGKTLAASGCFVGALDYQIEPKSEGVGYDVYILYPLHVPLNELLNHSPISHLKAINMGIDLCDALIACRKAGYLFQNLKPENIYLLSSGRFLLGDLGLVPISELDYSSTPETYIGPYSAPELSDIAASPNMTVDMYALGMVLYRIYNGNHGPFVDENTPEPMAERLRSTGKPLPTPLYADYELTEIIAKACAFRPEDRFSDPSHLKLALMLYMQRNAVSDEYIAPPIVMASEPVVMEDEVEEEEAPIRMVDIDTLDAAFRQSFAPDTTNSGTPEDSEPEEPVYVPVPKLPVEEAPVAELPVEEAPSEESSQDEQTPSETTESAENASDAEQLNVSELIASVNEVVGTPSAPTGHSNGHLTMKVAPAEPIHDYQDPKTSDEEEVYVAPKKKGVRRWLILAILVILLAGIAAVGYYLITDYFVNVAELNVIDEKSSISELTVELVSPDEQEKFLVTCTDSYGNAYPGSRNGNHYTFTGLRPETAYTITVSASDYHRLTSGSSHTINVITPGTTEIKSFTARRGEKDGQIRLNLSYESAEPINWIVEYSDENGNAGIPFAFEGKECLVSGLEMNRLYTFSLMTNTKDVFLSGQLTTQYELLPIVTVESLHISNATSNSVSLSWLSGENTPAQWTVSCVSAGYSFTETTTATEFTFKSLPGFHEDYTFSVTAPGMDDPAVLELPAKPIIVENLHASSNADGTVTISWSTPAGSPSGGWHLAYNVIGSYHVPYVLSADSEDIDSNSAVLKGLIPNAQYEMVLHLTAADVASVFGSVRTTFTTAEAQAFNGHALSPTAPFAADSDAVSMWKKPEEDNWTYKDLTSMRDTFATDEDIVICAQVESVAASDKTVTLLYVLRDENGIAVTDSAKQLKWDELWFDKYHTNLVPRPIKEGESQSTPGKYTLEIYVDGQLLLTRNFTIV